jgi:PAS domain S-box-containing protein
MSTARTLRSPSLSSSVAPLAPVAQWPEPSQSPHVVQFYSEDGFLLDALNRFIGAALEAGDPAVVIATKSHRDGLAKRLKQRGLDIAAALEQGRYLPVDARAGLSRFMRKGAVDADRFERFAGGILTRARKAAEGKRARVVIFGEMVALLWAEGNPGAAARLEELWNELARVQSFSLRCAYPMSGFHRDQDIDLFLNVCAGHSSVIPAEAYTGLSGEEPRLRNVARLQQRAQALDTEVREHRETQKLLQRRESELADFLDNAVEGVQQTGPDRKVLWANQAMLSLLGYSAEEYVGQTLAQFHVDPEALEEFWQRLMRREDIRDYRAQLRCKDGTIKHVLIHSNGVWEDGRFLRTRCFVRDVTEQVHMERALRENEADLLQAKSDLEALVEKRTAALRQLSSRILTLQDCERRRIARELHDSLGQYLVGLQLDINMLRRTPERQELWAEIEEVMQRCISETRTMSYLLHPPMMDEAGLASAARWYVDGFAQRSGAKVTLDIPGNLDRLPDATELTLFRVLQEALTNVHRHSNASAADIQILRDAEQVILQVRDNGGGIDQESLRRFNEVGGSLGLGLTGMRERVRELGGRLALESTTEGTSVTVTIPLGGRASV